MASPPDYAIETSQLTKSFGKARALAGVDLAVPAGTVFGLLGPNGAGKTTTVKVLATLLRPDGGSARVFGKDVVRDADAVRRTISLTGQYASVDEDLTGSENLVLLARLHGYSRAAARDRADQLLDAFGLAEAAGRSAKTYSGGMRRRLDIAASIVNTPRLLFLDEPTTGLDPRSRNQVWDIVRAVVEHGTSVLLTTQYLEEADRLASRIAVVDHGKVIAEGTPGQLKASIGAGSVHVRLRDQQARARAQRLLDGRVELLASSDADQRLLSARVPGTEHDNAGAWAASVLGVLLDAGLPVDEFALGQPSLDEVFLTLTDQPAHSDPALEEVRA